MQLLGLIRGVRPNAQGYGMTINGVAPNMTWTKLMPPALAGMVVSAGLPMSSSYHVGLAVVFSAVAQQNGAVEVYGKDSASATMTAGRWNGRVIFATGDQYVEMEETLAASRELWMGKYVSHLMRRQQAVTDLRGM